MLTSAASPSGKSRRAHAERLGHVGALPRVATAPRVTAEAYGTLVHLAVSGFDALADLYRACGGGEPVWGIRTGAGIGRCGRHDPDPQRHQRVGAGALCRADAAELA